ncbi:protein indeterminate-domain 16-like [Lolium rigidum]|uniref:protein indeterminate-domain 16-like n=1 Tax=Lolium rigidum TaxID=89674 RepID=UPI001F5D4FAA|nr:protein indeterminate-domain 16-like [Lolium rigidum]
MALVKSHHQMLASSSTSSSSPSSQQQLLLPPVPPPPVVTSSSCVAADQPSPAKRKRRPPGTPDPDAEVVALTPQTLLESDRYVCEICGQGFQREQNLQMHRRRHKVPWRLVKRAPAPPSGGGEDGSNGGGTGGAGAASTAAPRKRVFVCPEPSCLHHDPAHALGDLVGIKKHFRRKHGGRRQWVCARCAKGYAVQSDYKAHLKTCGTRGHSCDCGRVFSRVESFIEHQDACNSGRIRGEAAGVPPVLPALRPSVMRHPVSGGAPPTPPPELQLLPAATKAPPTNISLFSASHEPHTTTTKLELSIGGPDGAAPDDDGREEVRRAMQEKACADAERARARDEAAAAERALEEARRARQRARGELERACALRDHAARLLAQVTCHACRQRSFAVVPMVGVVAAGGDGHGHGHGGASAVACESLRRGAGLGL